MTETNNNNLPNSQQIQIKASDEQLAGSYANMMQVIHTKEEFVMDFVSLVPPQGVLASRVIISPAHAKRIAHALAENVKRYEEQFGVIEAGTNLQQNFGFRTEE